MTEQTSAPQPPQTIWECCRVWADLLVTLHVQELKRRGLTEEEAVTLDGLDRHLVVALIAAVMHERITHMNIPSANAVQVPLAAPAEEGMTGTLRRTAYNAVLDSPDIDGQGKTERKLLLDEGASQNPDGELLWSRVRAAAQEVVAGVASRTPTHYTGPRHPDATADGPYWERGITIGDVLIHVQRHQKFEQLAQIYGEED